MGETKSTKNRREKGAITLFILIAMFFFLIVLYSLYANNVSRLSAQRNYVADIQKQYEETIDEEKIKEEYDKITSEKIRIVLYIASTGKIYSTDQWTNQNLKMEIDFPESVPEGERYFFIDGEKKKRTAYFGIKERKDGVWFRCAGRTGKKARHSPLPCCATANMRCSQR